LTDRELINHHLKQKSPVKIYYNNETGVWQYSIEVIGTDLWLDSFNNKKQAIKYCKDNNLPITE
jgi:hypothetical protein